MLLCGVGIVCAGYMLFFHTHILDITPLEHYNPGKPSRLLDDEGNEWGTFAIDRRKATDLAHMPQHLIQAFLAAEDHSFFQHSGISWRGICRSLLVNIWQGKIVQGASTITQQLVKLLFTDGKRTILRKLQDQCLALLVEQRFSKEYILQTYLNHVCFGAGIYGVEAASQRFWSKPAAQLTVEESALLAGIVKSPVRYCPLFYPLSARKRRNIVLRSMRNLDFITQEEFEQMRKKPCTLVLGKPDSCAPHLKEMIRVFLEKTVGKKLLYTGGLTIQTTLHRATQQAAELCFTEHIAQLRRTKKRLLDGGLISLCGATGEIKALVGGFDFTQSQYNRAAHARRQLGSIIKPLLYAAALEAGARFDQIEIDEPCSFTQGATLWQPRNHTRIFEGPMTLARALAYSNNIISIKMLVYTGFERILQLLQMCQMRAVVQRYLSLALGCIDCTLLEAVGMFNMFAQHGVYTVPHYIRWVKDEWGNKLVTLHQEHFSVLDAHISDQVVKVLMCGMERVRKRQNSTWIDAQAFGKTGTTDGACTCWFVGATQELTTGIYIGMDDNSSLGNVYAASVAFPIWKRLYTMLEHPKKYFSFDPTLQEQWIDGITGKSVLPHEKDAISIFV